MEYNNLYYRQSQYINLTKYGDDTWNGTMSSSTDSLIFPITGHLLLAGFVLFFSIVMMNLLIGIAIADVQEIHELSNLHQ